MPESATPKPLLAEGNIYYVAQAQIQRSRPSPLRYIIVDDSHVVIDVFSTIVEMLDGQVVGTASTGTEGLVLYVDQLPDVVVMDISMPDMNGIEAIKSIFNINPAAHVIVISGNDYDDIRQRVFQLGVKVFVGSLSCRTDFNNTATPDFLNCYRVSFPAPFRKSGLGS